MKKEHDCCYEEMTHEVGGQSEPSQFWDEPMTNHYEDTRKYNEGYDWSGMGKK